LRTISVLYMITISKLTGHYYNINDNNIISVHGCNISTVHDNNISVVLYTNIGTL